MEVIQAYESARRYFRAKVQRADADDLAQEFAIAYMPHAGRVGSPERYTRRMMRNMLIKHSTRRRLVPIEDMEPFLSHEAPPDRSMTDTETLLVAHCLRVLRTECQGTQDAVEAWMNSDMNMREIGDLLGVSSAAVRMRFHRYKINARGE